MEILVLGGTAWLGRETVRAALEAGHRVTALARGQSGPVPAGVRLVRADRSAPGAYDDVAGGDWDAVVDVSRQPGQAAGAVAALGPRARSWIFVSSCSVYAAHDTPGAAEDAVLLPPHEADDDDGETYGGRKVACEQAVMHGIPGRALVARAGLIAGPGDHTDRTGYWPLRFAHPAVVDGRVLVPDSPLLTQVVDVRDLAAWLVSCAERGVTGTYNAVGPPTPLGRHLDAARTVARHTAEAVPVTQEWLVAHGVEPWSGDRSLPLWLPLPEYAGFMARDGSAAAAAGLRHRPLEETLAAILDWEMRQGPGRPRKAGLSPRDEAELIAQASGGAC